MMLCAQDLQHPTLDVIATKESMVIALPAGLQMNHQLGMRSRERCSDLVQARECTVVALAEHALRSRCQSNDPPLGSLCSKSFAEHAESAPIDDLEERALRNWMLRRNGRSAVAQRAGVAVPNHSPCACPWRLRTRKARNESTRLARTIAHDESARTRAEVVVVEHRFSARPLGQLPIQPAQRDAENGPTSRTGSEERGAGHPPNAACEVAHETLARARAMPRDRTKGARGCPRPAPRPRTLRIPFFRIPPQQA